MQILGVPLPDMPVQQMKHIKKEQGDLSAWLMHKLRLCHLMQQADQHN